MTTVGTLEAVGLVLAVPIAVIALADWVTKPGHTLTKGFVVIGSAVVTALAGVRAAFELGNRAYWIVLFVIDLFFVGLMIDRVVRQRRHRPDQVSAKEAKQKGDTSEDEHDDGEKHAPSVAPGSEAPQESPLATSSSEAEPSRFRETNVAFANSLLETEIAQRNARKDAQENTARGVIVTASVVLTLLLGLANQAGLFSRGTSWVARAALIATLLMGAGAVVCSMAALWPREYDRLGTEGLLRFNDEAFLNQPSHLVGGTVVATRIGIARKMDERHEEKAAWLKRSFALLAIAFLGVVIQGCVLAIDPPAPQSTAATTRIIQRHYL